MDYTKFDYAIINFANRTFKFQLIRLCDKKENIYGKFRSICAFEKEIYHYQRKLLEICS